MIYKIQRFSLHDGPGIRTIVFFKGCPLSCLWCCNPESQYSGPDLMYQRQLCIACKNCVEVCPSGALSVVDNSILIDRDKCDLCGVCSDQCPTDALQMLGLSLSTDEIMEIVKRDKEYFETSGGGVTLSGGEPFNQAEATLALLEACRNIGLHTAIETCGLVQRDVLQKSIKLVDLYLYDIKTLIAEDHYKGTGVGNEIIIENLKYLIRSNVNLILRLPLIPTFNMSEKNYHALVSLIVNEGIKKIDFMPFHRLGQSKYDALYRDYYYGKLLPIKEGKLLKFAQRLRRDTRADVQINH